MKASLLLFAGAALATSSSSPVVRDANTVTNALSAIQSSTESLGTLVSNYKPADLLNLSTTSQNVLAIIQNQTTIIQDMPPLTLADSLRLVLPVRALTDAVRGTVNAVITKKPVFVGAGIAEIVITSLQQQRDAAMNFSSSVVAKTPSDLQAVARSLSAPSTDALNYALTIYQKPGNETGPLIGGAASHAASYGAIAVAIVAAFATL